MFMFCVEKFQILILFAIFLNLEHMSSGAEKPLHFFKIQNHNFCYFCVSYKNLEYFSSNFFVKCSF
jgi:hypothetical protein